MATKPRGQVRLSPAQEQLLVILRKVSSGEVSNWYHRYAAITMNEAGLCMKIEARGQQNRPLQGLADRGLVRATCAKKLSYGDYEYSVRLTADGKRFIAQEKYENAKPVPVPRPMNRLDQILQSAAYRLRDSPLLLPVPIVAPNRTPDPWDADSNTVFFCDHLEADKLRLGAQRGEVNMYGRALWETQQKGIRGEIASAELLRDHNFTPEVWAYTALVQVIRIEDFENLRSWGLAYCVGSSEGTEIRKLMYKSEFGNPWSTQSRSILPSSGFRLPKGSPSDNQLGLHLARCVAMVLLHFRIVWFNPPSSTEDRNEPSALDEVDNA